MTNREKFIQDVEDLVEQLSAEGLAYFEELKKGSNSKGGFTENGIKILKYMQENYEQANNIFNAKSIGGGIFMQPRAVSGSMKKLINDGYVIKVGESPITYKLTDEGIGAQIDN